MSTKTLLKKNQWKQNYEGERRKARKGGKTRYCQTTKKHGDMSPGEVKKELTLKGCEKRKLTKKR